VNLKAFLGNRTAQTWGPPLTFWQSRQWHFSVVMGAASDW
jgi:hypothetical protein